MPRKFRVCAVAFSLLLAFMVSPSLSQESDTGPATQERQVDPADLKTRDQRLQQLDDKIDNLEKPLYSPFIERFLLDEVKGLRVDQGRIRTEMAEKLASSQLKVADLAMSYISDAVSYFFYLITGITTLLVIIGWTSFREVKSKAEGLANKKISEVTANYEKRLQHIEDELLQKSMRITANQEQIEETNDIHSLWLKATLETLPEAKINIYDQILMLRPDDVQAMTYKADAVLQLEEPVWAISLCNRALNYDPENANAYYQRACAEAILGYIDDCLTDLEKACAISEPYREEAQNDPSFNNLQTNKDFLNIINKSKNI